MLKTAVAIAAAAIAEKRSRWILIIFEIFLARRGVLDAIASSN